MAPRHDRLSSEIYPDYLLQLGCGRREIFGDPLSLRDNAARIEEPGNSRAMDLSNSKSLKAILAERRRGIETSVLPTENSKEFFRCPRNRQEEMAVDIGLFSSELG